MKNENLGDKKPFWVLIRQREIGKTFPIRQPEPDNASNTFLDAVNFSNILIFFEVLMLTCYVDCL